MISILITKDGGKIICNGAVASIEEVKSVIKPGTAEDIEQRIVDAFSALKGGTQ